MELNVFNYELEIGWFDRRNAKLAKMHENGTRKVVKRSHLYRVLNSVSFSEYINTRHAKNMLQKDVKRGLEQFGQHFINYYKNFVLSGKVEPKLKASTIQKKKAKGSKHPSIPLVDTGEMIDSIQFRINE